MADFTGARFTGTDIACIRGQRVLFAGLGFDLAAGGALLVTGPNGIGKSSLLRLMAGLLPAAAGRLRLTPGGNAAAGPAYLGHGDALKPPLTVAETLAFWTRIAGPADNGARTRAVAAAVDLFALAPLARVPCRYLSAGQRRRVALARVVAQGAPLWLLDEPTTSLDDSGVAAFGQALARHRAGGGMAVIAGHGAVGADGAAVLEIARFAGRDVTEPFHRGLLAGASA